VSANQHGRARELFEAASELQAADVESFLDAACGGDEELRREVASLLAIDEEFRRATAPPPELKIVDHFRVLELVGEGGMGEVWEAEQTSPVNRKVALKLVKWGMDTREVLARFEAERQALAWMNHPAIAAVYEAGSTDEGRPYFAMEYVDGVSITSYCDDNSLTIIERLELFLQVCEGVQHAHHKGVIHRDLKPSNVLVAVKDGVAVPKIIDFGVAKAISQPLTDRTLATRLGHWIGTPEYMSPEQAGAGGDDIDTRSDVYSLGVLLFELLAGRPPLDTRGVRDSDFDELRRRIREEEPPRPSTLVTRSGSASAETAARRRTDVPGLRRTLRGDLDWIILKALEKDRSRRYGSPAEFSADISRYLQSEPVLARPPSAPYRLGKYVRRNRVTVTAAVLVTMSLVTAVVGTTHGLIRARKEAETARRVSGLLESMILELNPRSRTGYASTPREIVDRMVERMQSELGDQPLEVARLMTALGVAYEGFGELALARPLFEQSAAVRESLLGRDHLEYAESLSHLGNLMADIGDDEAARRYHEEALEIRERLCAPGDSLLVSSLDRMMIAAYWSGDCDTAISLARRIFAQVDPAAIAGRPELEIVVVSTGTAAKLCGDLDLAQEMFELSELLQGEFSGPENLGMARSLLNYAGFLDLMGKPEEALPHGVRGLEIWERLDGPHDRAYAASLDNVATILLHLERFEAAAALYERALALARTTDFPPRFLGDVLFSSACALAGLGRTDQALDRLREAVDLGLAEATILDEPALASVRSHPQFEAILSAVQRPAGQQES
jgi:non-specific serine/threonine protein kinase/serine/threonine-protein kinase